MTEKLCSICGRGARYVSLLQHVHPSSGIHPSS